MTECCGNHGSHNSHNCIETLKKEHEKILEKLDALKNNLTFEQARKFVEFSDNFAEPHHHKEEDVLFPELEKRGIPKEGGPIGVMLAEHETKRGHIKGLKNALENKNEKELKENALAIVNLMQDHIAKENDILYPMAEKLITGEEMEEMGDKCKNIK